MVTVDSPSVIFMPSVLMTSRFGAMDISFSGKTLEPLRFRPSNIVQAGAITLTRVQTMNNPAIPAQYSV
jgi:hypothetical protein